MEGREQGQWRRGHDFSIQRHRADVPLSLVSFNIYVYAWGFPILLLSFVDLCAAAVSSAGDYNM